MPRVRGGRGGGGRGGRGGDEESQWVLPGHWGATNWLTNLHMAVTGSWGVGDSVAAVATRAIAAARVVAAGVSYRLYMHLD
jgi:hypothetical protein